MDFDFQKVSYDFDIDEAEEDDLRGLVQRFEQAQEQNIAEFEKASDEIDDLEGRVGEVQEFEAELTEELTEVSPLSEDEVSEFSISRKRDLLADFSEDEEEAEEGGEGGEGEEGEQEFSDFGTRGETHDEDGEESRFAEEYLGDIEGLEI